MMLDEDALHEYHPVQFVAVCHFASKMLSHLLWDSFFVMKAAYMVS